MTPLKDTEDNSLHNGHSSNGHTNVALFASSEPTTGKLSSTAVLEKPSEIAPEGTVELRTDTSPTVLPLKVPSQLPPENVPETVPQPQVKHRGPARRIAIFAALGIGAAVAGFYGYRWWQFSATHETTDNATVTGHIHPISSRVNGTITNVLVEENQTVREGQLLIQLDPRDFEAAGQQAQSALESARRKASSAQSSIGVTAQTAQGQTTQAKSDINSALAAIDNAQAVLSEARTGVPTAQAGVKEAQAGVAVAQAGVTQADANLQKLATDSQRYESLYSSGAIARQQLDAARTDYKVAQAAQRTAQQNVQQAQAKVAQANQSVAGAQAKIAQAQQGVAAAQANLAKSRGGLEQAGAAALQTGVSEGDYAVAKAAIVQAEANLNAAQLQLTYTRITAPTSGRVGRKSAEIGQRVQPGSQLMAIVDPQVWVTANFKETQLGRIRPSEAVEVTLDAFPHRVFSGRVQSLSPASGAQFSLLPPDNATGNFTKIVQRVPVKIVLDPQSVKGYESRIGPGMSAEVSVTVP